MGAHVAAAEIDALTAKVAIGKRTWCAQHKPLTLKTDIINTFMSGDVSGDGPVGLPQCPVTLRQLTYRRISSHP